MAIRERPVRDCVTCARVASAMPGAPLMCTLCGAIRRVEVNRDAVQGLCGYFGRMWRPLSERGEPCSPR